MGDTYMYLRTPKGSRPRSAIVIMGPKSPVVCAVHTVTRSQIQPLLAITVVIKASSATTVLYTRAAEIGTRTLGLDIFQFTQRNLLTLFQITTFCPVCGGST
jgi:hypothetical protein